MTEPTEDAAEALMRLLDEAETTTRRLPSFEEVKPTDCAHVYDLIGCSVINIYQCRYCGDWDHT